MSDAPLSRGSDGEFLPDEAHVYRSNKLPKDYEPGRELTRANFDFELPDRDKVDPEAKLSVFTEGLTTKIQACQLVGDGTTHRLIVRLCVEQIRDVKTETTPASSAEQPQILSLNVVWDQAYIVAPDGSKTPDERPGAEGHAGITGLRRPDNAPRKPYKIIQDQLCQLAMNDVEIITLP